MSRCCIVPPHILRELTRSGSSEVAQHAERTLLLDDGARRERYRRLDGPPSPAPDQVPGPQRTIHDAQQREELPGVVVRSEGEPTTGDAATDEAYDGLGRTWQMWSRAYGRDSLDGAGQPLLATVHYGRRYDNAFWDGTRMVFGDGDGEIFRRFTRSLDVIGHELAHGVTEHTSRLVYRDQSGALNEHVSDVFGVLVAQYHLGQDAAEASWLVGADLLMPSVQGRALRSMAAPGTAYDDPRMGKDPQPAHMRDFVVTSEDNGGVHINSGIPNKAFHLVATTLGGPAWERAGQVWFDVITGDIDPRCDFVTFAGLTVAAAAARYGDGSAEADAVATAWQDVGVDHATDGSGPEAPPAPGPGPAVRVSRSGGVAGMTRSRVRHLDELPAPVSERLRGLLAGTDPSAAADPSVAATESSRPDAFTYSLGPADGGSGVRLPQSALSPETREMLDELLRGEM